MANPFLVLGGIAVGLVVATFGVLQVPGWVASAQDAAAVNDLSNIRDAQMIHRSTAGTFTTDLSTLGGKVTADAGTLTVTTLALGEGVASDAELLAAANVNDGMQFSLSNGVKLNHIDINGAGDAFCVVLQSASGRYFGASENAAILKGTETPGTAMDAATCAPGTRGEVEPEPEPEPVPEPPANSIVFRIDTTADGCVAPGVFLTTPTATIDWDDNSSASAADGLNTHEYTKPGVYNITVEGTIPAFGNMGAETASCITSVPFWGETGTTSARAMFMGAKNLTAVDAPPAGITTTFAMFASASKFNQNLTGWGMKAVTDSRQMFVNASSFNGDVSDWTTSNITNMSEMFHGASSFNRPLNRWDTTNVTLMSHLFKASGYNQPLDQWNTAKVTSMKGMFQDSVFNQDISGWNISRVSSLDAMFYGNKVFNQPIGKWSTTMTRASSFQSMFRDTAAFDQDISTWPMSPSNSGQDFYGMFAGAEGNFGPIGKWNMSKASNVSQMFMNSKIAVDLSSWTWVKGVNVSDFATNSKLTGLPAPLR